MSYWLPWAVRKPLRINYTARARSRTDGVILHVAAGESLSLHGWFSNPKAKASSHLYVRRDGTVEQYIDLDYISWASAKGDQRCISVETQGQGQGEWTARQVASLARIIAETSKHYGFPLRAMTASSGQRGIGYHALGVPGSLWQKVRGVSQTGGELWSKSVGKICPGPDRIRQVPNIVAIAGGTLTPPAIPASPTPPSTGVGCVDTSVASVAAVQQLLAMMGFYRGVIDGVDGALTKSAILAYQRGQKYHGKLACDGYWGTLEQAHYEWVARLQSECNKWKSAARIGALNVDGNYGSLTARMVYRIQADNRLGAYQRAVTSLYGAYKARVDGIPGKAFCSMLGIPNHPYA